MRFRFGYTGLRVTDLEASLRFFRDGLGMRVVRRVDVPEVDGELVLLQTPGAPQLLELNWYAPGTRFDTPYSAGEGLDHLQFRIEDGTMDAAIARLEAHGGTLVIPPFEAGPVITAFVNGPDGHTIELMVPRPGHAPLTWPDE